MAEAFDDSLQLPLVAMREMTGNEAPGEPNNRVGYVFERIGDSATEGEMLDVGFRQVGQGYAAKTEIDARGPYRVVIDKVGEQRKLLPGHTYLEVRTEGILSDEARLAAAERAAQFMAFLADNTQEHNAQ